MKFKNMALAGALCTSLFSILPISAQANCGHCTEAPANAKTYIISPKDGDTVPQTFTIKFGLSGMGVAPAGTDRKHTGHHHLLIDGATLPELNKPLGKNVKHFGGGQTEATVTLESGEHTLQLILGDMKHQPHNPPIVSDKITITVK